MEKSLETDNEKVIYYGRAHQFGTYRAGRADVEKRKKALDQDRLNVVKSVVDSYCEFKDVPNPPTKEMIHQELGGILFSIRESHKKHSGVKPKKVTGSVSHTATNEEKPREVKGHIGKRKNGVPARAINYKAPSFVAPLDLSDGRSPVSLSPS
ncbi:uncharacterized protein LOC129600192 [Paramacrobiotus metropolitanus]|uniref:uncharacterized protein LOC129600192 n=1 Tax=Paramacrobiotus metropolitanus TaxID=2943436 RepID=UPI002445F2E6|nr:uncharacterized protein LOC129600192 [Paramacrobiotus metropolitanus]